MLADANAVIQTISASDLPRHLEEQEAILVDVRDTVEREKDGGIPGSVHAPRGMLEFQADPDSPAYNAALEPGGHIILYCASGGRSALAAKTLLDMGYEDVSSLGGGYAAWQASRND